MPLHDAQISACTPFVALGSTPVSRCTIKNRLLRHRTNAAYCCTVRTFRGLRVRHAGDPCELAKCLTDRDAAWDEDSRVPKNHGACTLAPSGNYDGICGAAMRAARCRYH